MDGLPPISERVRRLVEDLKNVETIEALLLLHRQENRSFSARDLGIALHVSRSVEPMLERLASLNLLEVHVRGEVRYRYAPGSPELHAEVAELEAEYGARRLAVLEVLSPLSPMNAFADAFRFRRKKRHDG